MENLVEQNESVFVVVAMRLLFLLINKRRYFTSKDISTLQTLHPSLSKVRLSVFVSAYNPSPLIKRTYHVCHLRWEPSLIPSINVFGCAVFIFWCGYCV